ncbi:MAG: type II toxin-antitoxin system VapB family antitoxin [Terracidiphilus sp.]
MPLSIKSPEADRLARELAATTGATLTIAVTDALREQLTREKKKREDKRQLISDLMEIAEHSASLPDLDTRSEDEIMGWDENGLPS